MWLDDLELFVSKHMNLRWHVIAERAWKLRLETALWAACEQLRTRAGWLSRLCCTGITPQHGNAVRLAEDSACSNTPRARAVG